MESKPKAYMYQNYEGEATVFFASSPSKARAYAHQCDICTEDDYIDIRVKRFQPLDYMEKPDGYELDWNKDEDRLAMVSKAGMMCYEIDLEECSVCICKDICESYSDYMKEVSP